MLVPTGVGVVAFVASVKLPQVSPSAKLVLAVDSVPAFPARRVITDKV
jgi:hypothetical protein